MLISTEKIHKIPHKTGIYFLYEKEDLVYIGISNNIRTRIKDHLRKYRGIDRVGFLLCKYDVQLETSLINYYKPKYNIQTYHTVAI